MGGLKWQNLIHKKCPRCDSRLNSGNLGFGCSGEEKHFFISRQTMAKILTDPNHAAIRFATEHEKAIINEALEEMTNEAKKWYDESIINRTLKSEAKHSKIESTLLD